MRSKLPLGFAATLIGMALGGTASAHVSLTEKTAEPGARYVAHFRVGHGCSGSATTALTVAIPAGVTNVAPQAPDGWSIATVRSDGRVISVTWKGGVLAADKPGEFVAAMTLPKSASPLAFAAIQLCEKGEEHWDQLPSAGATLQHPAPILNLTSASTASLAISDGWIRALPAGIPSGGYFTLRNSGAAKAVLIGAQSPGCGMLMLHKSETGKGMAAMDMVGAVDVPAGGTLAFAPNGYHLMCMDARPIIKPGATVPVTLEFQDGGKLTADFAVRNAAGK